MFLVTSASGISFIAHVWCLDLSNICSIARRRYLDLRDICFIVCILLLVGLQKYLFYCKQVFSAWAWNMSVLLHVFAIGTSEVSVSGVATNVLAVDRSISDARQKCFQQSSKVLSAIAKSTSNASWRSSKALVAIAESTYGDCQNTF